MVVSNHWTGLLDWNTGMYWTEIFFGFAHFKGGVTVHLGEISVLSDEYCHKSSYDKPNGFN